MDTKTIIQNALTLSPAERILILEALSKSLSQPNKEIDDAWKKEIEARVKAFDEGKIKTISYEEILKNNES
ncbi:MAG: addiction module protein [Ignavibacteriota bacterium]